MKNHRYYSKETQIEIFDEIAKNQGTTEVVNRDTPIREWNYNFLLEQSCIEQELSGGEIMPTLIGERITDSGKT
jgi:hypothetical protein